MHQINIVPPTRRVTVDGHREDDALAGLNTDRGIEGSEARSILLVCQLLRAEEM